MVGVLLLGFVLVVAVLVCSFLQASFPVALSVVSLFVALMVAAGGGTMVQAVMSGGVVLVGGLVLATASDTYEEISLARRRAKPRQATTAARADDRGEIAAGARRAAPRGVTCPRPSTVTRTSGRRSMLLDR